MYDFRPNTKRLSLTSTQKKTPQLKNLNRHKRLSRKTNLRIRLQQLSYLTAETHLSKTHHD